MQNQFPFFLNQFAEKIGNGDFYILNEGNMKISIQGTNSFGMFQMFLNFNKIEAVTLFLK